MENLTVEEALEQLLCHTKEIEETEEVSLLLARGRILAKDEKAEFDNPPFDRSPVDGYACHFEDLSEAKSDTPAVFTINMVGKQPIKKYFIMLRIYFTGCIRIDFSDRKPYRLHL